LSFFLIKDIYNVDAFCLIDVRSFGF